MRHAEGKESDSRLTDAQFGITHTHPRTHTAVSWLGLIEFLFLTMDN